MEPITVYTLSEKIQFAGKIKAETIFHAPQLRVVLLSMGAGSVMPNHAAPGDLAIHAIQGDALLTVGDQIVNLLPGTLVQVAPGVVHQVEARSDSALVLSIGLKP